MVVMVLEKVPRSLRGELSRWMQEIQTGVFVGTVSAIVRDLLWEKCVAKSAGGRCCQVYHTNTEMGLDIRLAGHDDRSVIDFDGIPLVALRNAAWEAKRHLLGSNSLR
jgi:CRISPR-associated protein Cas2